MSEPTASFNLWSEPWIRVTRLDGGDAELGIGACLAEAHDLAALSDPSPLVVGGTHRLLAAILQAIYAPRDLGEIASLLRAGQFDPARLAQFADQHAARFDLFHPSHPFLQTGDVPLDGWKKPGKGAPKEVKDTWVEPSSVSALFTDIPGATNRIHFHHTTDESHQVCAACCARGLITIPTFARAEGGGPEGYRPAITGGPPIYIFPTGKDMFLSLSLSLITQDFIPRKADPSRYGVAIWNIDPIIPRKGETSAVGYLESLCFPLRRIRLFPRQHGVVCTICDRSANVTVHEVYLKMGLSLRKSMGVWDDPFVGYQIPRSQTIQEPYPIQPKAGKEIWREYNGLLLSESDTAIRPGVIRQLAKLIDRNVLPDAQRLFFRCIGLRADQAKVEAWFDEALETPPVLLRDPDGAYWVDLALQRANVIEEVIEKAFNQHFRPLRSQQKVGQIKTEQVRFRTIRARMTTDYWQRLAPRFRVFINDLADEGRRDQVAAAWVDALVREGRGAFDAAAEQIGTTAEALRARVEAQAACHRRLNSKRKEWIDEQS